MCLAVLMSTPGWAAVSERMPQLVKPELRKKLGPQASLQAQLRAMRGKQAQIRASAARLAALAREPKPRSLPPGEEKTWQRYRKFLLSSSRRMARLAAEWDRKIDRFERRYRDAPDSRQALREMQEMNLSFNIQYLRLQNKIQAENREFAMLFNIMKLKRDAAKSAIENVR